MKLDRTATVIAAAALVGGLAGAAPARAGAVTTGGTSGSTSTATVVTGPVEGLLGNRHQLNLQTRDGGVDSRSTIRSYSCPSGARITPFWASASCTHRSTFKLSNASPTGTRYPIGRISPTMASASQRGPVLAKSIRSPKSTVIDVQLSIFPTESDHRVTGRVGGSPLQATPRYASFYACGC